jgi:hypothetical protein
MKFLEKKVAAIRGDASRAARGLIGACMENYHGSSTSGLRCVLK